MRPFIRLFDWLLQYTIVQKLSSFKMERWYGMILEHNLFLSVGWLIKQLLIFTETGCAQLRTNTDKCPVLPALMQNQS